jgi:hypothetical protein
MERHRNDPDPVLRGLACGYIKPGDDIELVIRQNPHYHVLRFGEYVVMDHHHGAEGGTRIIARGGVIREAMVGDCLYNDTFFRDRERDPEDWKGYSVAVKKRSDAYRALHALVGTAAARYAFIRPTLTR